MHITILTLLLTLPSGQRDSGWRSDQQASFALGVVSQWGDIYELNGDATWNQCSLVASLSTRTFTW